jgi:hypothetical protein
MTNMQIKELKVQLRKKFQRGFELFQRILLQHLHTALTTVATVKRAKL